MIWSYSNGSAVLDIEATFDDADKEFVLKYRRKDGTQHVERFKDEIAFRKRLELLDHEFEQQRWRRVGPPVLLGDRWNI